MSFLFLEVGWEPWPAPLPHSLELESGNGTLATWNGMKTIFHAKIAESHERHVCIPFCQIGIWMLAYRQPTFSRRSRHCRPARVLTWHFCVLHSLPDIVKLWMIYLIVLTMNGNYCVERSLLWLPHFDYKSYINTIQCKVHENDQWRLNVLAFSTVTSFPSSKTARVLTSRISAVFSSNSSPSWVSGV